MEYIKLYKLAEEMIPKAYAPYSNYSVGAALLTKTGKVFTGVNIENATYGATICAERVAAVKAISEGLYEFEAIAVASSGSEAFPCGICRQFLSEFGDEIDVITSSNGTDLHIMKMRELLPHSFSIKGE